MYVEGRRKGLVAMCCIWIAIPLVTVYLLVSDIQRNDAIVALIVSGVFSALGIAYYAGKYEFMTGFSTMSIDEIVRYDMVKITWFSGVWLYICSFVFYTVIILASAYMGGSAGAIVSVVVIIAMLAIWAAALSSKRFKAAPSDDL